MLRRALGLDDAGVVVAGSPGQGHALAGSLGLLGLSGGLGLGAQGVAGVAGVAGVDGVAQQVAAVLGPLADLLQFLQRQRGCVPARGPKSHLPPLSRWRRVPEDPARRVGLHAQHQPAAIRMVARSGVAHGLASEKVQRARRRPRRLTHACSRVLECQKDSGLFPPAFPPPKPHGDARGCSVWTLPETRIFCWINNLGLSTRHVGARRCTAGKGVSWRRGRDSNPRYGRTRTPDFESGAFDHSATSPGKRGLALSEAAHSMPTPPSPRRRQARRISAPPR